MTDQATLTLADFLLARVAEDEAVANQAMPNGPFLAAPNWIAYDDAEGVLIDAHRVLAECEAKRRIVKLHPGAIDGDECPGCGAWLDGTWKTGDGDLCPTLLALAQPYAAHPDFREEWRL